MNNKEITTIMKRDNGNGNFKITVKNVGIIAVVVGVCLTTYGWISNGLNSKADKIEVTSISRQLSDIQQKLVRLETLLEVKK